MSLIINKLFAELLCEATDYSRRGNILKSIGGLIL